MLPNLQIMITYTMKGTKGRGTRHVVYWKHTNESGVQPLKVNLIVYDNDVLQVGSKILY